MKFGASLNDGLVPEWKAQYVDYKEGKKLIHKAEELRQTEIEQAHDLGQAPPTSLSNVVSLTPTKDNNDPFKPTRIKDVETTDRTPLLRPIDENNRIEIPLVMGGEATGLNDSKNVKSKAYSSNGVDPTSNNKDDTNFTESSRSKYREDPDLDNGLASDSKKFYLRPFSKKDSEKLAAEGREEFIKWANGELTKVDRFFVEKELESYERFLFLQDQIYQLREHKLQIINRKLRKLNTASADISTNVEDPDKVYTVNQIALHARGVLQNLDRFELPSLPLMTFLKKWQKTWGNGKKTDQQDNILLHNRMEEEVSFDPAYEENKIRNGQTSWDAQDDSDGDSYRGEINSEEGGGGSTYGDQNELIDSESLSSTTRRPPPMDAPIQSTFTTTPDKSAVAKNVLLDRKRNRMDYTKKNNKKTEYRIPYLYAKKQLKNAVLEYYRSLSLLKSYKIMNRTALRKITKKFDKAMDHYGKDKNHFMKSFMEKVDNSYFQTSDMVDKLLSQIEELFLLFFDNGSDRKHLLEKLRSISYVMQQLGLQPSTVHSYYSALFSSGLLLGFGLPLFILAVYLGVSKSLSGELPEGRFMLQIWAGFFLMTLMLFLFGINTLVFDHYKINYKFIFEFNLATCLDHRQMFFLPSFSFACLSLLMWFSFNDFWPIQFPGRDWPWIFWGGMIIIFLWTGSQFYGPSRKWFQIALWRLLWSGFYPVEFRDFFLGDILSSLTYTMGNISFFFCLYSHHWNGLLSGLEKHNVCGSNKSRSMGFFATLPSIWRFLQCVRRYMDTGDAFPHVANMLKYSFAIIYYALLSVYRIDTSPKNRYAFIVIASINSIYSALWDIVMDWSLLQTGSKNFLLRDNLFYKRPIYYYGAIFLDVILKFQWVFYACFANHIQQLAVTSFCIALAEVIRRFIWIFFRMENEHCTNVILFRASKESPLPYPIKYKVEVAVKKLVKIRYEQSRDVIALDIGETGPISTSFQRNDEESDVGLRKHNTASTDGHKLRRKSTFVTFSSALNRAHIKDFQRRKTVIDLHDESDEDDDLASVGSGKD